MATILAGATAALLKSIPDNLAGLRAEWVFHARDSKRLEVTPLVVNGMMFVTASNDAFALDARTGRVVWHHSWPTFGGTDR